jgi:hypothetical protein
MNFEIYYNILYTTYDTGIMFQHLFDILAAISGDSATARDYK